MLHIRKNLRAGLFFALTAFALQFASAQSNDTTRLLVQFDSAQAAQQSVLPAYVSKRQVVSESMLVLETTSAEQTKQLIAFLKQAPHILFVEKDELRYPNEITFPTNDTYAKSQWNLSALSSTSIGTSNAALAWTRMAGISNSVVVAVIDTGITQHSDLDQNVLPGYDFISEAARSNDGDGWDADPTDAGDFTSNYGSSWHGTAVAGVIASQINNAKGTAGVSSNVKILPIRVSGSGGGLVSDVAAAIRWAAGIPIPGVPLNKNPAKVINLSLSTNSVCFLTEQYAINEALDKGVVFVSSAGNYGTETIASPANCTGVIAVTAATKEGDIASYSNRGPGASIAAPGGGINASLTSSGSGIWSTSNNGKQNPGAEGYAVRMGTSFAAPHVAAAAAMLLAAKPSLTPSDVKNLLLKSARSFASNTYCAGKSSCGAGLLDINAALAMAGFGAPISPSENQASLKSTTLDASTGGGGGCTVSNGKPDPMMLILLFAAALGLRRLKRKQVPSKA